MKMRKIILTILSTTAMLTTSTSCDNLFLFINGDGYVPYENTKNCLFFALYNYYGFEGQHFTNRWLGMKEALKGHGITITNDEGNKYATKFKITREDDCDLPEDAEIYMVNNQTWNINLQYGNQLISRQPMAIISTCNGVEFAASQILANSPGTQNATMGGFSDAYRKAFENHSLGYLAGKYSCNIAPIVAAAANAVRGNPLRDADNNPLRLEAPTFAIKSIYEYDYYKQFDVIGGNGVNPTIMKSDMDRFFTPGSPDNNAEALAEWCKNNTTENIIELFYSNRGSKDEKETGNKIKVGLIVPGSVNDTVQANIDFISGYLADVYNLDVSLRQEVSTENTQPIACTNLVNAGAELIFSLQDDTNRNAAIEIANENKVYFANVGTCQNDKDFDATKDYPYFVGSVGSTIDEEREATKKMTEYYIQKMIDRANGIDITKDTIFEGK